MKLSNGAILIVCLFCLGCKPDLLDPDRKCKELKTSRVDAEYITPSHYFTAPCFNPNNSDEFVYLKRQLSTNGGAELWKYDRITGENDKLASGAISFAWPRWSTKDWILYVGTDYQLWKVKANGDSLTQLNFYEGGYRHADWNHDGTKIVIGIFGAIDGFPGSFKIDKDGFFDSKLHERWSYLHASWSPNGKFIAVDDTSIWNARIGIFDSDSTQLKSVVMPETDGEHAPSFSWFPDSKQIAICSRHEGVFIFDFVAETFTQIKSGCGSSFSRRYINPSVSSDGDKMLVTRQDRRSKGRNKIEEAYSIVIMNTDGTGEEVIDLSDE